MKRQQGTNKSILRETTPRQNQNLPRLRLAETTVLFVVTIDRELGPHRYKACAPLRVPPQLSPQDNRERALSTYEPEPVEKGALPLTVLSLTKSHKALLTS